MATINMAPYLGNSASYNDTTGVLSLQMATNQTAEKVVADVMLAIYTAANNKRTDLNWPIARKSFEPVPNASIINRSNEATTNPTTELQIEFDTSLVLFFRYDESLVISNIVRAGD